MFLRKYLVVNSRGSARITKMQPKLDRDEIAIRLEIELPNELFQKPMIQANIKVPKEVVTGKLISAEMQGNIEKLVQQATGLTVAITVVEPPKV